MNASSSSSAWQALLDVRRVVSRQSLHELFQADNDRFSRLSMVWEDWLVDYSKQRVTPAAMSSLVAYADERNLRPWIDALFSGEKINLSERRPALHTALRQQDDTPVRVDGSDIIPRVRSAQAQMRSLVSAVRQGARLGASGHPIRNVVNIGIGGSDLGPLLVCDALGGPADAPDSAIEVAFVSNVDPEHLSRALARLDPANTQLS